MKSIKYKENIMTVKTFNDAEIQKLLNTAKEMGISHTKVMKAMRLGKTLKELTELGVPLSYVAHNMELAIMLLLREKDSDNYVKDKTKPQHELQEKFLEEMKRWKMGLSYSETDDYLESCSKMNRMLPVNKVSSKWHKLLLLIKKITTT